MKYMAQVTEVLRTGIHTVGALRDGQIQPVEDLPLPQRLEIELNGGPEEPCMMYRYTESGESCGDTWHATLQDAFEQADFEYGLSEEDFRVLEP